MSYRKCFVPTCKNDLGNSPNKIFVRIREDLREKWCRAVNTEYFKVYTQFCCEDHFDVSLECYKSTKYHKIGTKVDDSLTTSLITPVLKCKQTIYFLKFSFCFARNKDRR